MQHQGVHQPGILVSLSTGILKINGPDAAKLLQGQLTCDINSITDKQGGFGAHCNPQGRIISLFYLFLYQDAYYLLMPRNMVAIARNALNKYAVFYRVTLSDESDQLSVLGYSRSCGHETATHPLLPVLQLPESSSRFIAIGNPDATLPVWKELSKQLTIISQDDWQALNIQEGIPAIYAETTGLFLPHELNLQELGAISFEKGCYTGQEIIARMHYRGKLKKRMQTANITCESPPLPGTDLNGMIVDMHHKEYNNYQVLMVSEKK